MQVFSRINCVFEVFRGSSKGIIGEGLFGGGGGRNQANKPRRNGWRNEEVKEAILRRKEACRQHRKYNRLREAFSEVI